MAVLNNPQGQVVNIPVTPNMQLQFGFDPGNDAQLERVGDNLVFKFPDGGEVILTDFYALPVDELPKLDVQGAEISAQDFLASLGDDTLLPAAGPTAPAAPTAAPGTGLGPYSDGAGQFIDGIDHLGMLGRIFWTQPTGNPITEIGLEVPGGTPGVDTRTDLDGAFAAGAFEDAMPNQNVGDYTLYPAQLHFNFTPTGTTTVTDVALSGFDAGTKLYIGLPGQPGTVEIDVTGPGQVVHFSQANFNLNGVYLVPPANSDHDMNIHADVTLTAVGGLSTVIPVNFVIVVDAVADLPTGISTEVTAITDSQPNTNTADPAHGPGEVKTVSVHAGATFSDVLDGTEHHYIEMRGIPSDWTIKDIPQGWVLVDANGKAISFNDVVRGDHSTYELRFDVTNAATADAQAHGTITGNVGGNVVFDPHDWTSTGATDSQGNITDHGRWTDGTENYSGPAVIEVRGTAIETPSDQELDLNNNHAESAWAKTDPISVVEDTPDIGVESNLHLDEQHGIQASVGEVPLASLAQNIQDAIGGAISGKEGAGALLGVVHNSGVFFDLHSDGYDDTDKAATSGGVPSSNIALSWNMDNLPQDLSAKLPEHDQYYELHFRQSGPDASGQYTLLGYYEVGGKEYVALVGVLTPDFATGTAEITFAQYAAFQHADGLDRNDLLTDFGIKITDDEGDVALATVALSIQDDVPIALGDTGILGNEASAIRGSVLSGADPESSYHTVNGSDIHQEWDPSAPGHNMQADDYGSDGRAAVDGLVWKDSGATFKVVLDGGTEVTLTHNADHTLTGSDGKDYGTLDLNSDGTFEYTKPAGAVFKGDIQVDYTITDADKDSADATLVIKVTDSGIIIPDGPGPDGDPTTPRDNIVSGTVNIQVNESGLHRGTDPDNASLTDKTGTFTIDAKDGLATLFIGGQQILFSEDPVTHNVTFLGVQGSADGSLSSAKYGDMVITNITGNPTTGYTVSYHYTLDDRAQHGDNVAESHNTDLADPTQNEAFSITMTDKDGDSFNGNIAVTIVDDAPIAVDDAATFDEKVDTSVGGNVLLNDMSGADGWQGGGWSDGKPLTSQAGEGGNGVVGYELNLPAGYSVAGNPATLTLGQEYTILYKSTLSAPNDGYVEQGTFVLKADGTWSFSSNAATQDVVKDFNFTAHYTIKDADGDTDSANLNVTVKAAPILAGLSGDTLIFESTHTVPGASSTDDTAGKGHYDIQLYNYNGSAAEGPALYEDVTVTVKVSFGTAGLADFDATAIQALPGYTPIIVGGVTTGFTFTQTVFAGDVDGKVSFDLPLADDSRGGYGTTSDGPVENYKLEITGVSGATAGHYLQPGDAHYSDPAMTGVHTDQNTNIVDDGTFFNNATGQYEYMDNRLDGATPYSHSSDAHPLDGPMLNLSAPTSFNEGSIANVRLVDTNPNTGSAYAAGVKSEEPIELTMKFSLTNGADAADVIVKYASVTGVTYQYSTDGNTWTAMPAAGIPASALSSGSVFVKATLPTGFDLSGLKNVGLNVTAVNDNLNEAGKHEGFSVALTNVHGNESTYYGNAHGTEIIDNYSNTLAISGAPEVWEAGTLAYTLTLHTDAAITSGTDTVKVVLDFSGTATFGSDYTLADIKAANPNLTFTDLGGGKVEVSIPPAQWTNQTAAGDHTITLKVPTLHDNQIGEHDEHVVIKIDSATGAEIATISGTGDGIIHDDAAISLTATDYTHRTPNIYEDQTQATANNAETIAHYQVNFKHDTGFGSDHLDDGYSDGQLDKLVYTGTTNVNGVDVKDVAATSFTFDISLKDGSAGFDSDMTNNTTDANTKDYGWALPTGLISYGELDMGADFDASGNALTNAAQDYLIKTINDYLQAEGFTGIKVIDVSNHGRTLTFQVDAGADLSRPLPINVGAIDDRITENPESFSVILSNIKADADTHIKVDTDRKVDTTILDDHDVASRDGFLVGLENSSGQESDKFIKLPVVLFERDAHGDPISVDINNPPTQDITITIHAGEVGDTATINKDYYVDANGNLTVTIHGGTANWAYVAASGTLGQPDYVPAHWVAKNVGIPLNDDRLTEGAEDFTVKLVSVSGHESSLLPDGAVNGINGEAQLTIMDDTLAAGNLDGPALISFGPMADVIEPVRTSLSGADSNGDPINQLEGAKTINYQVTMSQAVAQPTIVFIDIKDTTWSEFKPVFGNGTGGTLGILGDGTNGTWTYAQLIAAYPDMAKYGFDDIGLNANGGGYFLVIPTGSAVGTFGVEILHDHDTANNGRGIDVGVDTIDMTITNIQGSETTFDKANPGAVVHTNETIQDDMHGPVVSLELASSAEAGKSFDVVAKMGATATEDVIVRVQITDAEGNVTYANVTIPAGHLTGSEAVMMPNSDYIYVKVSGSDGGETQHDSHPQFMDLYGTGDGGNPRIVLEFESSTNIKEEGETTVGYTIAGHIPAGHVNEDLSFTLRVINDSTSDGDFKNGGPGSNVTVTIPKDMLDALTATGASDFKVVINPDGTVSLTDGAGNLIGDLPNVTGNLAQALDDRIIEGDESFSTIITNITGNGTVGDANGDSTVKAIGDSKIIDNDIPEVHVVFCDKNGNILPVDGSGNPILHGQEGHDDVYVKVILTVPGGDPANAADRLDLGNGGVTFNLDSSGSTAAEGTDFSITRSSVTIPNGSSESAPVRIILPDDFKSEGPETLTINAAPDTDPATVTNYPAGFIPGSTNGHTMIIDDFINGPQITFSADKTTVPENGAVNYTVTLDKALEENATLTFKVPLYQGDTKDGFTASDIESVHINGADYTIAQIQSGAAGTNAYIDADGNLILNLNMANGYSKDTFSITLHNDVISESDETLNVTLIETHGGELGYGGFNADGSNKIVGPGNEPTASTTVTDVLDGPSISLVKVDAYGTEGESITVGVNLSKATVSETSITLKLGADVYDKVVDHSAGHSITLTDAAGQPIVGANLVDNGDGTVTITLPTGVSGTLHVEFPLQDNAITGDINPDFSISLDKNGISGGEASLAGDKNYGSDFVNETPGSQTFMLGGGGVPNADASCTISLSGIPGNDKNDITSVTFTVGGHNYTVPGSDLVLVNGKLTYTLTDKVGVSLDGVQVTVNFNTAGMTPAELAAAKLNTSVSGTLSGMELNLHVNDDANTANQDGPVFSMTADAASALDTATSVSFTIGTVIKPGFTVVEDPAGIKISFKLTGDFASKVTGVALGDTTTSHVALSGPVAGVYTITLDKDANLTDWVANGGNKLVLTMNGVDNVVAADHNLGIQITGVSNTGEASVGAVASASTVVEDTTLPAFTLTGGAAASENGGHAEFTLAATNTGTTQVPTSVSFTLGGTHGDITGVFYNGTALIAGPGGVYTATVPAGTNLASLGGHITVGLSPDADVTSNSQITLVPVLSSSCTIDASAATVTVLESGLNLVLTSTGADVSEGGIFGLHLSLQNAATHLAVNATEALTVTFLVSGLAVDGHAATIGGTDSDLVIANATHVTWTDNGGGTYLVTATLPVGASELDIHTTARADGIVEHDEGVSFQVQAVALGTNAANIHMMDEYGAAVTVGHTESFTIHDGDMAHLPADYSGHTDIIDVHGMEIVDLATHGVTNYDGHLSDHGLAIQGTAGDNIIIGSDHNDIIFGGGGHDILTGGLGDDIFGWHSADAGTVATPAVDTITDFSMNVHSDPLAHNGAAGDDHLDLRDLISDARDNTLDSYLKIDHSGDNAVLHISTTPGGDATQTIVLENVYSNHGLDSSVQADNDHMDELIKAHIILNHG